MKLPRCGGTLENRGNLSGVIQDAKKHQHYTLTGSYASDIWAHASNPSSSDPPDRKVFACAPLPEDAELQYHMTELAITLNAPVPGQSEGCTAG